LNSTKILAGTNSHLFALLCQFWLAVKKQVDMRIL
jgi:hypothetical protein